MGKASQLVATLGLNVKQAFYSEWGNYYMPITDYPCALFDQNGYVIFHNEAELEPAGIVIGKRTNVRQRISNLPGYVPLKFTLSASESDSVWEATKGTSDAGLLTLNDTVEDESESGGVFGDAERNSLVEQAAIHAVTNWYQVAGWQVKSVERDRVGYDLHCTREHELELAEVKGIAGFSQMCIVTEGECQVAAKRSGSVVWLVTAALSRPELHRYSGSEFLAKFEFTPIQYRAKLRLGGVSRVAETGVSS